jgi:energy-coupling factor transport system ATP-binding protein
LAGLSFESVGYRYPGGMRPALDGIDLHVEPGELVLVVGESGCGKSTLLRAATGLVPHFHGGELSGRVTLDDRDTRDARPSELARHAGLVFQDPESQLVTERVLSEPVFGLENLGFPPHLIAAQAHEALMATGASHLAERRSVDLSGGEQQRVAIAAVLAMGTTTLLLDEPTSQLDPVAAEELLGLIVRLNHDRGITVVLAEHRTARLFAEADRVVVMEAGRITFAGAPEHAARHLAAAAPWLLPPVAQAFVSAGRPELPLSVKGARALGVRREPDGAAHPRPQAALGVDGVSKQFGTIPALRNVTAGFEPGVVTALLGENGAGKSTLGLIACGLLEPDRGRVRGAQSAGYVSQNPAHYLIRERVADEVAYGLDHAGVHGAERDRRVGAELERFGLADLAERHPRDLSSGERQRLAIASVTVMRPRLLVLDEPTRGMDGLRKLALGDLARSLAADGAAVAVITHDVDFAAEAAELVTLMGRGQVLSERVPRSALAQGTFFVSQLGLAFGCSTLAEAADLLRQPTGAVHA